MPSTSTRTAARTSGDPFRTPSPTANFLAAQGWTPGLPWGFEVLAPESYDFAVVRADLGEWRRKGFTAADGRDLPEAGGATLFAPPGGKGPGFLVTDNYRGIKTDKNAQPYALGGGA